MNMNMPLVKWILFNVVFVGGLYLGLWYEVAWLTTLAAAVVWLTFALYASAYLSNHSKQLQRQAPWLVELGLDALVVYAFITHGWHITALAYLVAMTLQYLNYRKSTISHRTSGEDRLPNGSIGLELQIAVQACDYVVPLLSLPTTTMNFLYSKVPLDGKADYLLGFISAAVDVVAQHLGGESGGNGSINGTLRTLKSLFGNEAFEWFFQKTSQLHKDATADFSEGFAVGCKWANAAISGDSDRALNLSFETFAIRYRYCLA